MSYLEGNILEYLNDEVDHIVRENVLSFNNIKIDSYNNQGCNGYVFFGRHKIFRCRVAIKYYYFGENSHEEIMLLKVIQQDNILKIWDASIVGGGWAYFVTDEICDGTIDDYLSENSISQRESLKITRGILKGLSELHMEENQLLHRDIKPANILLAPNCNPIIADFGSVKRIEKGATSVNPSGHSALYKPPEAIIEGVYSVQSDIYQAGLVMYQVFGGLLSYDFTHYLSNKERKEYEALTDSFDRSKYEDAVLNKKIVAGKLLNLDSLPVYTHNKIKKIIRKATHPNLEKRYSNTSEFFLELHQLGAIPDWTKDSEEKYTCKYKDESYRVDKVLKGFVFQKSGKAGAWRKVAGVDYCDEEQELFRMIDIKLSGAS